MTKPPTPTWHLRRLLPFAPVIGINQGRKCHQQKGFSLETGAYKIQSEYFHVMMGTLQGTNIYHLGKRKIIFKMQFFGDMLVPRMVVLTCVEVLNWNLKRPNRTNIWPSRKKQNHFESALRPMDTSCQRIFPLNEVLTALLNLLEFSACCFPALEELGFLRPVKFNQHTGAAHMTLKSKMLSALTWHGLSIHESCVLTYPVTGFTGYGVGDAGEPGTYMPSLAKKKTRRKIHNI